MEGYRLRMTEFRAPSLIFEPHMLKVAGTAENYRMMTIIRVLDNQAKEDEIYEICNRPA
jgi:hypothetical protein